MLKFLKKEANMTHTENGAVTYRSTQSECLDLFATIGALRRERDEEITNRFLRAYAEDADLAMKTLFFARDIRGGIGERRVFRTILKWLASNEPRSLEKNIQYIAEYGRYDDLLALMGTTCEGKVLQLIKKQLAADFAALEAGESVSLLAKWLPSVNASNEDVIRQAKRIARAMGMNDAQYRKTLSALRTKISIIENNLREKDYTFDYSKQPSKAMFKYRKAFMRNDGDRYDEFMSRVAEGTEQLHTGTLTPYEMIKPFFGRGDISDQERKAIDATWKTQEISLAVRTLWSSLMAPAPCTVVLIPSPPLWRCLLVSTMPSATPAHSKTTSSHSLRIPSWWRLRARISTKRCGTVTSSTRSPTPISSVCLS